MIDCRKTSQRFSDLCIHHLVSRAIAWKECIVPTRTIVTYTAHAAIAHMQGGKAAPIAFVIDLQRST